MTKIFPKKHVRCKECISCGEQMPGVHSYEIRDTCRECGGKSKVEYAYLENAVDTQTEQVA